MKPFNENGNALREAVAFCRIPGVEQTMFYSDGNGVISLIAENGTYDFCFFANDYMPKKQVVVVDGISSGNNRLNIKLKKSELMNCEFVIEELDIEEIQEHGIDITKEENQYVCKVKVELENNVSGGGTDNDLGSFNVYVNQKGETIMIEHNGEFITPTTGVLEVHKSTLDGEIKTSSTVSSLGGGRNNHSSSVTWTSFPSSSVTKEHFKIINKTMVSLSVTEYSWLKDFFEISITITNNAAPDFQIDNAAAKLILPVGLSLAETDTGEDILSRIGTIPGGESKTVKWIVRGNNKGNYNVSVDFTGVLSPFGIPIETNFQSNKAISIVGGDTLKLILDAHKDYAEFSLTNTAHKSDSENNALYDVCVNLAEINTAYTNQFGDINDIEYIIVKYPSGLVEKIKWVDATKTATKSTIYLPVWADPILTDDEKVLKKESAKYRTLEPQEAITGIIVYRLREKQ